MSIVIRPYQKPDLPQMIDLWNAIVNAGDAFPQEDLLDGETGRVFFGAQTLTAVAEKDQEIVGLYILHPNNLGRCGHIANSSYAVKPSCRGEKIGEKLVVHSLEQARTQGFRILQFNAVVATNTAALTLYKKLGFSQLGVIPGGFRIRENTYLDIIPHFIDLT